MPTIQVPNEILMAEVADILSTGSLVRLRAKGRSMSPYIRDGRDLLVLSPLADKKPRVGDSVLALTEQGQYVMHRIIAISGDRLTLMGDGNLYGTETCKASNVLGVLVGLERNGRYINVNSRDERLKAWAMRKVYRIIHKTKHRICTLLKDSR